MQETVNCPTCKSSGFEESVLGPDFCTFCDGTEGGQPPVPVCDLYGDCEVSDEDEASGTPEAMCIHCGGWRYRDHPFTGNWGKKF